MSSSFDAGIVYKKCIQGDALTDQEVSQGIERFRTLERDLRKMGREFKFPADEVQRVLQTLLSINSARNERPFKY